MTSLSDEDACGGSLFIAYYTSKTIIFRMQVRSLIALSLKMLILKPKTSQKSIKLDCNTVRVRVRVWVVGHDILGQDLPQNIVPQNIFSRIFGLSDPNPNPFTKLSFVEQGVTVAKSLG